MVGGGGTSTLRALAPSPTSSAASSQATTPTSPLFMTHSTQVPVQVQLHSQGVSSTRLASLASSLANGSPHDTRSASSLSISHPRPTTPPLLQPPAKTSFTAYLRSWGDAEIAQFLSMHRCGQYASAFKQHDITGSVLVDLDMNALKEIGVAKVGERVKLHGGIKELRRRAGALQSTIPSTPSTLPSSSLHNSTPSIDIRINGSSAVPSAEDAPGKEGAEDDGTLRTRRNQRPPPLDLLPHASGRPLPMAYQNAVPSVGFPSLTPRPRPAHSSSSSTTITPASLAGVTTAASSTAGPPRNPSFNTNLRAPPPRDGTRRSPSPGNSGSTSESFTSVEKPLGQSSAAEYASSITQQRNAHSTGESIQGLPKDPALANSTLQHLQTVRNDHRKYPSVGTPPTKTSPIRATFQTIKASATGGSSGNTLSTSLEKSAFGSRHSQTGGSISRSSSGDTRQPGNQLPLEDIRRQFVRFVNSQDGTSRTVGVADCTSGVEVLERVLKKFGMWTTGAIVHVEGDHNSDGDRLEVDGWGVYAESEPDDEAKPLSEASLLAVCLANRDGTAVREKGLLIRQTNKHHQRRKNMEEFFGETPPAPMSPTSPKYSTPTRFGLQSSSINDPLTLTPSKQPLNKKRLNRASTVSIMSGLGVPLPDGSYPPSPLTARTPTASSFLGIRRKPLYNFFGHRPPSELIANHLGEYFPSAKRKELEKSRNSMLRLSTGPKRLSVEKRGSSETDRRSIATTPKRKSHRPSSRATMTSPPSAPIPEESESTEVEGGVPRVSVSNDSGRISRPKIDGESDSVKSVESQPPLLPPLEPPMESLAESLKAFSPLPTTQNRPLSIIQGRRGSGSSNKSRLSMMSQLRKTRDRSDNASLLTVDEITAEVDQRRASMITFDESSGDEGLDVPPSIDPGVFPQSETDTGSDADDEEVGSSAEEESEEEEDDDDDDEEEEEEELEDEHGKAFTSTGSRIFKWIKGALIGAGSFGSVYLGMDAQSGLLMAVKQVELPTGSERNEERKRNMVDALEREIELLKELQHDNIVQYLDSSADGAYLNIFLEYVPGGSVAALLSNYGAFEEALVRNFCRQILTGLNYLHERDIIHRDIKGANILVDNKGGIKISDFGISKKVESSELLAGGGGGGGGGGVGRAAHRPSLQGSVFWMAPEVVKQTSYTKAADIWSVGCLVVEMLTGTRPWADLSQMQAMYRIGQVARPTTPADISPEAADFLARAFEFDHGKRPTAAELLEHPFITSKTGSSSMMISAAQARQAMAQANRSRENMMGGMQSLSAFG